MEDPLLSTSDEESLVPLKRSTKSCTRKTRGKWCRLVFGLSAALNFIMFAIVAFMFYGGQAYTPVVPPPSKNTSEVSHKYHHLFILIVLDAVSF